MSKYINVEKLKAEIERFSATEYGGNTLGDDVANGALDYVLEEIIPSLQQEEECHQLLSLLLEAIDYSFMKPDKTYDATLTYPVIDKVNYIKKQLNSSCQYPEVNSSSSSENKN